MVSFRALTATPFDPSSLAAWGAPTPAALPWVAPTTPLALSPAALAWAGLDTFQGPAAASAASSATPFGAPAFPGLAPGASALGDPRTLQAQLATLVLLILVAKLAELTAGRDLGALSPSGGGTTTPGTGATTTTGGTTTPGTGATTTPGTGATTTTTGTGGTTAPRPAGAGVAGQRVLVLGDSLMVGARDATTRALEGAGAARVSVDAEVGRAISASGAGKHLSPAEIRQQAEASGANVVVLELGSNHADYARFIPETMNELAKLQPPPTVVWVNTQTQRPAGAAYGQSYYDENARINEVLAREAARRPNLHIADWASIAGGPGINAGDGLHLTAAGSRALADLITRTIQGT